MKCKDASSIRVLCEIIVKYCNIDNLFKKGFVKTGSDLLLKMERLNRYCMKCYNKRVTWPNFFARIPRFARK